MRYKKKVKKKKTRTELAAWRKKIHMNLINPTADEVN